MINRIQLLRNIGQFDSVSSAAKIELGKLTLIYAENGRGKTTLSAVLRSLATGEALPITERHRLGAAHAPEVVVALPGKASARFQNGAWTQTCPDMMVFDDVFVDLNVHSGLDVGAEHRQNLHELILGEHGVALARHVQQLADAIRDQNTDLRSKTAVLQNVERHGVAIDAFCALPILLDLEEEIAAAQKRLASLEQADAISKAVQFVSLSLPEVDGARVAKLLAKSLTDVDANALASVRSHFGALGAGAEPWIASGTRFAAHLADEGSSECPFCLQPLASSSIFSAYRAHFAESYRALVNEIGVEKRQLESSLSGDALAGFERQVQHAQKTRAFWASFCELAELSIDTTEVASAWQAARDALLAAFTEKQSDPLRTLSLDAPTQAAFQRFSAVTASVGEASAALDRANEDIERVKEAAKAGSPATARTELARLRATKERHTMATAVACAQYLAAKAEKERLETEKETAQAALDSHRATVFAPYQAAINKYLGKFNAGFSVEKVQSQNSGGSPSCNYQLLINAHRVPLVGSSGARFKNTLSAGDRSTLALAFFFASLERDPKKSTKVVVLDDPVSSLDEHRTLATVQEVRALAQHVGQVIVLSHSKPFLARIWQHADQKSTVALEVARDSVGSTIVLWNVNDDSVTEHDRRHERLREYKAANSGNHRDVAQAIRPVLECYLRVTCPAEFPPGTLLGPFRQLAKDRAAAGKPVLDGGKLTELEQLTEYANRFHHDTNPAWDTAPINDTELQGFVGRALALVAP